MKKRAKKILSHPLISGSTVVLIGMFIANLFGYFYSIGMANYLTNAQFGILSALIAVINIVSIIATTIITVFTKFSASYVGMERKDLIKALYIKGTIWIGIISFLIIFLIVVFTKTIADFLHIEDFTLIYISGGTLFFAFLTSVGQGVLIGLLKFFQNSLINILSSIIKFLLAIIMVYLGMQVFGGLAAIFIANVIGYLIVVLMIQNKIKWDWNVAAPVNLKHQLMQYGLPVFLSTLGITAFISSDIILVKHFFNENVAGDYAKLSLMGRSIFYLVVPVVSVSFPLFAQKMEKKENLSGMLILSLLLIGIPSLIISVIYFLFPKFIIQIFLPAQPIFSIAPLLGIFSLFIVLFSISYVLNNFYLSIGKTNVFIFTVACSLLEILVITLFHNNLYQIIYGLIGVSLLLMICLLFYYPFAIKEQNR